MSKGDMVLQAIAIALMLYAFWTKWGQPSMEWLRTHLHWQLPLFKRRQFVPSDTMLLTTLFLEHARQEVASVEPPDQAWEEEDEDLVENRERFERAAEDLVEDEEEDDPPSPLSPLSPLSPPAPTLSALGPRPTHLKPVSTDTEDTAEGARLDAWMVWMLRIMRDAIHLIVIGQTGAGKTTVLQSFVEYLVKEGVPVVVCDPDAAGGDWPGTEIHGGGDDFDGITAALRSIQAEARSRRQLRAEGQRLFPPLWIVLDEYADIKDECKIAGAVVENLLRRARKLNIHLVIGVQDTQVKTMGFERRSALLNNARTITLRLTSVGTRVAAVDDEPAIRIPKLTPAQGPTASTPVLDSIATDEAELEEDDPDLGTSLIGPIEDKDEQILVMLQAGASYGEIASALHVATTRIARVKRDHILE